MRIRAGASMSGCGELRGFVLWGDKQLGFIPIIIIIIIIINIIVGKIMEEEY